MSQAKVIRTNKDGRKEFLQQNGTWSESEEDALPLSEEDAISHRRVHRSKDIGEPGGPFEYDHLIEL
jgi:hypothetical protein